MDDGPITGKNPGKLYREIWGKDVILVPAEKLHVTLPLINQMQIPDQTFWAYDKAEGKAKFLTTLMPGDTHYVSWWLCRVCASTPYNCSCKGGIVVDRSTEYIYDKCKAMAAGEEWGIFHPDYYGSIVRGARDRQRAVVAAQENARKKIEERARSRQKALSTAPAPKKVRVRSAVPAAVPESTAKIDKDAASTASKKLDAYSKTAKPRVRIRKK